MPASTMTSVAANPPKRTRAGVPLAGLRVRLDDDARACHWSVDLDEIEGRSLVLPAPGRLTFPIRLQRPATASTEVRLLRREWRDGTGAVAAAIAVVGPGGEERPGEPVVLNTAQRRGRRASALLIAEIPADSTAVVLTAAKLAAGPQAAAHVLWLEPELVIDGGPSWEATPDAGRSDGGPRIERTGAPLFSVLCPVHDPPAAMLAEAITSVRTQSCPDWELCLVDDGSQNPDVISYLDRQAAADPRISLQRLAHSRGISGATNVALAAARGEYIALLDHDDALATDALELVASEIDADPGIDMIYTDEEIVRDGRVCESYLKPGWAPESLCSFMFTCHLGVYRRSLAVDVGGFRSAFDGAQDHDFALRVVERTDRIRHLARPAYRWRAHADSTAAGEHAKPYAAVAGRAAVAEHLGRRNIAATVSFAGAGYYTVVHDVSPQTRVSIVIAVTDPRGLGEAAASWLTEPHQAWDLVLVTAAPTAGASVKSLREAGLDVDNRVSIFTHDDRADPASGLVRAAAAARGDHLLLLQSPAAGLTHGWMRRLVGYSQQEQIVAAIPTIVAGNGQIQDAGIAMPSSLPLPLTHGIDAVAVGPVTLNVLAAGSAMMTSRAVYERLGGLDASFRSLALSEFCLRARAHGLRAVSVSEARLQTTAPDTAVNDLDAIARLGQPWSSTSDADPYYNPNYLDDRGDFSPRSDPIREEPAGGRG
jgi:GT2 family glycosyltransferase